MTTNFIACPVCEGSGGHKKPKKNFLDDGWADCLYCEGAGFTEDFLTEEKVRKDLLENKYISKITLELSKIASVKLFYLNEDELYVKLLPDNRKEWVNLVKYLLRFAHYSEKVSIVPKQAFYLEDDANVIYWELYITTQDITDLDGVLDILRLHNQ